jgi:phenylalanyl-tRNA synthetase beta chain
MKFTLSWLKEHLDTTASLDEIARTLTMLGLEVEGIEDKSKLLEPFTSAYVIEAKRHPDSDHLNICRVDTGRGEVTVICGAPNARTGMKAVYAAVGTTIPGNGLKLVLKPVRGVESNGMLVSEREMGLSDAHEGIIELAPDAPLNVPFAKLLGLDDPVIEIKLTPNRGDCLGVRGIARDLAAAGLGTLKPLALDAVPGAYQSPITTATAANSGCAVFFGRHFRNVKNGPSPDWLQRKLRAVGLRPISALVDITNYSSITFGRPLHVYDAAKVQGPLTARLAKPGEKLLALDGKEYEATAEDCVIADAKGPAAFGGIMGGELSGCSPQTTEALLESALFDPVRVAATGRRHGILSDARYRFERGVDPAFAERGLEIATRLILELCGGECSNVVRGGHVPDWRRSVTMRASRPMTLGGLDLPVARSLDLLTKLGFDAVLKGDVIEAEVPSWRPDIVGEPDLVEEVLRLNGYDAIPAVPLPATSAVAKPAVTLAQRRVRIARRALAAAGLNEAVTYSFVPRAHAALFGGGQAELVLSNPISADMDCMRPSPLPGLLAAAQRNADKGQGDAALFEVGPQYAGDRPDDQAIVAAAVRRGMSGPRHWTVKPRAVDVFDARSDAMAVLAACGVVVDQLQIMDGAPGWYHPGRSGTLRLGPKTILAAFGELHPAVLAKMDVKGPAVACEVFLGALPQPRAKATKSRPALVLNEFQAVERDFAFVLDRAVTADQVVRAAKGADKALITRVEVFDLFEGASVGEGRKSLAITVRLEPKDRTLTDKDIEAAGQKVVAAVTKATGAVLRG